jgi:hypothetical protein
MNSIWKINSKFITNNDISLNNIYFCSYCCSHVNLLEFRKLLIKETNPPYQIFNKYENCIDTYSVPKIYTKCKICNRFLQGIQKGPDIIKFLDNKFNKKISDYDNNIYLQIGKVSTWYYHGIYDDFGNYLKKKYNYNSRQVKNIYQSINELYALPSLEVINEKAEYILNMVKYKIIGFIPK